MKKVILLFVILLCAGCGSRRKEVKSFSSKYDFKMHLDTTFRFSSQLLTDIRTKESSKTSEKNTVIEYEGGAGDSLSIQNFGADGKLVSETRIKGSGKTKIIDKESSSENSLDINSKSDETTNLEATGSKDIEAAGSEIGKAVDIKRSGTFPWWLWLIVIVVIALYLNYRFKWIWPFKKHVLKESDDKNNFA